MLDYMNLFLQLFSGISQGITSIDFGGYNLGSVLFGGFVLGIVFSFILRVLRRR